MIFPLHPGASILAEHPCGLLAIDKPESVLTHPNKPGACKHALIPHPYDMDEECYYWEDDAGIEQRLYILNRLDSPTSGIIVAATSLETAQWVRQIFRERKAVKKYFAVVKGFKFTPPFGTWTDALEKVRDDGGSIRSRSSGEGKKAVTHFKWLRGDLRRLDLSLLELTPETGLTHQLRVQCVKHKHPILGDKTYGDFGFNKQMRIHAAFNRLGLHAAHIEIPLPDGEIFTADSLIPPSFAALFGLR